MINLNMINLKTECFVLDMQMALGFITHLNQPA